MPELRTGFVTVVGRPNVGKSTLINAVLGQKIAAVTPRPQTTLRRQLGILTRPDAQIIFVDTPGIHDPRHKLGEFLNQEAEDSLEGVDVILYLVDASTLPTEDDQRTAALLNDLAERVPVVVVANKIDLVEADLANANLDEYRRLLRRHSEAVLVSATRGDGLQNLVERLIQLCPVHPAEFEADQITDLYEREIAAGLIREAALLKLRDEVPHSIAVRIEEFKERSNGSAFISATILVERDSQKGIVIGKGGRMLKQIGTHARREIESMGGRKIFLELRTKVDKGWRSNPASLERLGYKLRS